MMEASNANVIPVKSGSGKSQARIALLKKYPNCFVVHGQSIKFDMVCFDELQRLLGLGKGVEHMTYGSVVTRVIADIRDAFVKLHASTVVICFDSQNEVPTAKGAEQATRDIASKTAKVAKPVESDAWEYGAIQNLKWNQRLPLNWDEAMKTQRNTFRKAAIRAICTTLTEDDLGRSKWSIPNGGEVIFIGHCIERYSGPLHVIGPLKEIESTTHSDLSIGEAEMQMFVMPSIMMQTADQDSMCEESKRRALSIALFSTDTDVLVLTMLWLWKVREQINPLHMPEVTWTFNWNPNAVVKTDSTVSLTKLEQMIKKDLPGCVPAAIPIAYFYLTAGSDYTEGYHNAPHNLFLDVLFDNWNCHFRKMFEDNMDEKSARNGYCLNESGYAEVVWYVLKRRKVSKDVIVEQVAGIPFEYVLFARSRQLMYIWHYLLCVGCDVIQPPNPTATDGYATIVGDQPMSKTNVRRLPYMELGDS